MRIRALLRRAKAEFSAQSYVLMRKCQLWNEFCLRHQFGDSLGPYDRHLDCIHLSVCRAIAFGKVWRGRYTNRAMVAMVRMASHVKRVLSR